jgi:hypothetical protein
MPRFAVAWSVLSSRAGPFTRSRQAAQTSVRVLVLALVLESLALLSRCHGEADAKARAATGAARARRRATRRGHSYRGVARTGDNSVMGAAPAAGRGSAGESSGALPDLLEPPQEATSLALAVEVELDDPSPSFPARRRGWSGTGPARRAADRGGLGFPASPGSCWVRSLVTIVICSWQDF